MRRRESFECALAQVCLVGKLSMALLRSASWGFLASSGHKASTTLTTKVIIKIIGTYKGLVPFFNRRNCIDAVCRVFTFGGAWAGRPPRARGAVRSGTRRIVIIHFI